MTRKIASTNWFPDAEVVAPLVGLLPDPEHHSRPDEVDTRVDVEVTATAVVVEASEPPAAPPDGVPDSRPKEKKARPPKAERRPRTRREKRLRARATGEAASKPSPTKTRAKKIGAVSRPRSMRAERRRARTTWRKVVSLALFAAVVGAWFVTLRPTSLGGPASVLSVRGVSMEPTYQYGDIIIAHKRSEYRPGDIVAFRVPEGDVGAGAVVIHRIIGGDATAGFITQGDNNPDPDEWRPVPSDILGAARWRIPALGRMVAGLRTGPGIAVVAGALAALLVIFGTESHRAHPVTRGAVQPEATSTAPAVTAELHSDVAAHREAPEVALDPQPIDPPPVASTPCEGVDSDPLDDLIVPPPLRPVASPGLAATDAASQPPIAAAVDEIADEDGSEDDILSMDLHLGPRPRPRAPEADDDDHSVVGEYWGDLGYLAALLRPKQEPVLFDDDLEAVAEPSSRAR